MEVTEKDIKFAMQCIIPATVKNIIKVLEEVKGRNLDMNEAAFVLNTLHSDKNIYQKEIITYHLKETDKYYDKDAYLL